MKSAATALRSGGKALGKSVTYIEDELDAFKTRLGATANDIADVRERVCRVVAAEVVDICKLRATVEKVTPREIC